MTESTKLRIDFNNGTFDGEGDPAFLEKMYEDFSNRLEKLRATSSAKPPVDDEEEAEVRAAETIDDAVKVRRRRRTSRGAAKPATTSADKVMNYAPTRVKDLDLSGLAAFYSPWAPRNHPERILLFARFLEETLQKAPCTADQIFSCYLHAKERVPEAFLQAFRDAGGNRYGFIDFKSPNDISVTITGLNHLQHGGLKKKGLNDGVR